MTHIHLIGTIHYDLKGLQRLERALDIESPDILTVEADEAWQDYIAAHWNADVEQCLQMFRAKGVNDQTQRVFESFMSPGSPFEIDACRQYAGGKGIPLHFIDEGGDHDAMHRAFYLQLDSLLEIMDRRDLEIITRDSVSKGHDEFYRQVQRLYAGEASASAGQEMIDAQRRVFLGGRDVAMAKKLSELAQGCDGKIVHVGGFVHTLTDISGETLYSRLRHLNPTRKTLWAYDQ